MVTTASRAGRSRPRAWPTTAASTGCRTARSTITRPSSRLIHRRPAGGRTARDIPKATIAIDAAGPVTPDDSTTEAAGAAGDLSPAGAVRRAGVLLRTIRNPIIVAALVGVLLAVAPWQVPEVVFEPFRLVGAAAAPMALVAFGMSLAVRPPAGQRR